VLESRQPMEEEIEADFLPNQDVHWLHHQIVPITDGVAVNVRDITSRKETELAMRKNQAELAAVNDASPLGLLRADATGHCTYVNRTFELITGLTREEALGDAWMRASTRTTARCSRRRSTTWRNPRALPGHAALRAPGRHDRGSRSRSPRWWWTAKSTATSARWTTSPTSASR
jgi:PAS domain-containing protein